MQANYHGIQIDTSRDSLIDNFGQILLKDFYLKPTETSPQEAFARTALAYCYSDINFAQRIYDYVSKGWFMFASPVISNAPTPGEAFKGLPISCFLTYVGDSLEELIDHTTEIRWLSVRGGGTAGHWSNIRAISDKAPGPIPFLKTVDADMTAYRQGKVRRGSYAAYLDISHPDIQEFIQLRTPTGGDENRKCFNLHLSVNITDNFMLALEKNDDWDLIDPATSLKTDTVKARELWQQILETRAKTGEPYICFIDTANKTLPQNLKDLGYKINGSNLCTEILLPTGPKRTAVCCLSSLNAEYFEDWKSTPIVEDLIKFLDNVLQSFIDFANPKEMPNAILSAHSERSIGLGVMGFHALLQKNSLPFESALAVGLNHELFSTIQQRAIKATEELAVERGEYPDGIGTGKRNAHLIAVAPNANSSIIFSTSPSIEPWKSNAFTHRMRAGSFPVRNRYLNKLIDSKFAPEQRESIWQRITLAKGSIQTIEEFSDWEKLVFKTAFEIDQEWIIQHAADRQQYICQGQSVNLFFPANTSRSYVNYIHLKAWKSQLKTLYYYRTSSVIEADNISTPIVKNSLSNIVGTTGDECLACHA